MTAVLVVVAVVSWLVGMGVLSLVAVMREAADRRNVVALADRYGLDPDTATRLYVRARQIGFAAAYLEVVRGRAR